MKCKSMPNIFQTINVVIAGGVFSCYRCHGQLDLTNVMKFDAIEKKIYYHCNCGNTGWRSFDATIMKVGININDVWCDYHDAETFNIAGMSISSPAVLPSIVDLNDQPIDLDSRDEHNDEGNHEPSIGEIAEMYEAEEGIHGFDNDESTHIEDDESVNDPDSEA